MIGAWSPDDRVLAVAATSDYVFAFGYYNDNNRMIQSFDANTGAAM